METLEEEINDGRSKALLKDALKSRIIDTAKHIKSNDDTFKIATLPQVSDRLCDLMCGYTDLIQKVDAVEKAFTIVSSQLNPKQEFELNSFENLFQEALEAQQQASVLEEQALAEFRSLIIPAPPRDEEIVVEAPTERRWPKDPITQTNIKKAVRNKVCNHIYDRVSIEAFIDQRKANKQRAPCPVAGCRNKNTEKRDLEPDDETNLLIESLKDAAS